MLPWSQKTLICWTSRRKETSLQRVHNQSPKVVNNHKKLSQTKEEAPGFLLQFLCQNQTLQKEKLHRSPVTNLLKSHLKSICEPQRSQRFAKRRQNQTVNWSKIKILRKMEYPLTLIGKMKWFPTNRSLRFLSIHLSTKRTKLSFWRRWRLPSIFNRR